MLSTRLAVIGAAALLFGCGGGGGGGGGSSAPQPSKFFTAVTVTGQPTAIGSVINPNPPAGTLTADRIIEGASTGLAGTIGSLALDIPNDRLYVGNQVNVRVFNSASLADGNVPPTHTFSTKTGPAFNAASLFIDTGNNRLYLGDDSNSQVRVYNNASGLNGTVDADRVITGFDTVLGVQVDTTLNILYVTNKSPMNVYTIRVFDGADTVNGAATVSRTITPHFNSLDMPVGDMFMDAAHDRLYVAGGANTIVMVFDTAHSASGSIAPTKTMTFPLVGSSNLKSVLVDTVADRLYALEPPGAIIALSNQSTASGAVTGTAALAPPLVSFTAIALSP